jgi:hypothetical protein
MPLCLSTPTHLMLTTAALCHIGGEDTPCFVFSDDVQWASTTVYMYPARPHVITFISLGATPGGQAALSLIVDPHPS